MLILAIYLLKYWVSFILTAVFSQETDSSFYFPLILILIFLTYTGHYNSMREISKSSICMYYKIWKDFVSSRDTFAKAAQFKRVIDKKHANTLGILTNSDGQPFINPNDSLSAMTT